MIRLNPRCFIVNMCLDINSNHFNDHYFYSQDGSGSSEDRNDYPWRWGD